MPSVRNFNKKNKDKRQGLVTTGCVPFSLINSMFVILQIGQLQKQIESSQKAGSAQQPVSVSRTAGTATPDRIRSVLNTTVCTNTELNGDKDSLVLNKLCLVYQWKYLCTYVSLVYFKKKTQVSMITAGQCCQLYISGVLTKTVNAVI